MNRELVASYVVPILFGLLLYFIRFGMQLYKRRVESRIATETDERKRAAEQARLARLQAYAEVVEGAVADVEVNMVRDLKDPAKPGKWTDVAMRSARETAREKAKNAAPKLVDALRDEANVDALTDLLIERQLHRQRGGKGPTFVPATPPDPDAPSTSAPPPAPSEDDAGDPELTRKVA